MEYKKTAKDIAFDKERSKLKSEIWKRDKTINEQHEIIRSLNLKIDERDKIISELKEVLEEVAKVYKTTSECIANDIKARKELSSMLRLLLGSMSY